MTVPKYEPQVRTLEGSAPGTPSLNAPPPSAFGTGIAEQTEKTGNILQGMGKELAAHVIERTRQDQRAEVVQADTAFRTDLQKAMFDSTPDDKTGVPKGVFQRQGDQARGATVDFDAQHMALRKQYVDSMASPYMKMALGESMDENYPRLRELVAHHEGAQVREGNSAKFQAGLDTQVANAALYSQDPNGLIKEIELGHSRIFENAAANGIDKKGLVKPIDKFARDIVTNAITPLIAADPKPALDYLEKINADGTKPLSPAAYADIKNNILIESEKAARLQEFQKNQVYDSNMRHTMLDYLDGKLPMSELQRRYREDDIKRTDFDTMQHFVADPNFAFARSKESDYGTFNKIREAQLSGSNTPGELDRMVAEGMGTKGENGSPAISKEDAKYLLSRNKEIAPNAKDQEIKAQAQTVRDFGTRYFKEGFLEGMIDRGVKDASGKVVYKSKKDQQVESAVSSFLKQVDQEGATGPRIAEIADETVGRFAQQRYPGVNPKAMPHVVVGIDGKIQRLFDAGHPTKAKAQYKIVPAPAQDKGQE